MFSFQSVRSVTDSLGLVPPAQSSDTVSARPLSSPPLPASFNSLPPELKAQIARHVHENDDDPRVANVTLSLSYQNPQSALTARTVVEPHAQFVKGLWLSLDYQYGADSSRGRASLRHLSLDFDLEHEFSTGLYSSLLRASSPTLTHLILSPSSPFPDSFESFNSSPTYRHFLTSFSSLTRLHSVELWSSLPLPTFITGIPTPWTSLRRLLLDCAGPEHPRAFIDFLSRFTPTLEVLEMFNTPRPAFYAAHPLVPGGRAPITFDFPRLKQLTLSVPDADVSFLPYLSPSTPLQSVKVAFWVPRGVLPQIKDFVARRGRGKSSGGSGSGGGTLQVFEAEAAVKQPGPTWVQAEEYLGEEEMAEVERACEESGVRFVRYVSPESDDEEE
ncbi:hypothetical protein JCM6882_005663 [Rhodosporidiobolus microsporus]